MSEYNKHWRREFTLGYKLQNDFVDGKSQGLKKSSAIAGFIFTSYLNAPIRKEKNITIEFPNKN